MAERGGVVTEAPDLALPPSDAAGGLAGLTGGWQGTAQPVTVDATMDPNIHPEVLRRSAVNGSALPLARILIADRRAGLNAGTARARIVVRTAGVYGFSVGLARSSLEPADGLVRFGRGVRD